MAKTLAIKVQFQSTGEEKIINNIEDLEGAIEQLSKEIKTLDFGTEEYEKAAGELAKLKAGLRDVDREIEGLDAEQRLTALAGATELVAGSFLIASSAARTFGASAETIEEVEKLEQQALEAVNIALGIRAVTEGLLQAAQLKRIVTETAANVQTKVATALQTAYTAVVGTSTGALKAFRLALASTGIGLIVVALGALIANWDKLTKSIGGATDAQDDFNKVNAEAQKSIAKTNVELDFYAGIVNDVTKSEEERVQALEELNRLGVITEDITLDQSDALETLNERLELTRKNILLKAQAEAAASLLSEAFKAQIEAQNSSLEDNIGFWERTFNAIISGGNAWASAYRDVQTATENQAEAINEAGQDVERFEAIYLQILEQLNKSEAELNKTRDDADKKVKSRNDNKRERNELDAEYNRILEQIAKSSKEAARQIDILATSERDEVKIIEDANKILEKQNELLEERLGILGTTQGETEDFADSLERLVGGIIVPDEIIDLKDNFNEIFKIINEGSGGLSAMIDDGSEFGVVYGEAGTELEKFSDLLTKLETIDPTYLSEEQKQILIDFFDTQVRIQQSQDTYFENLEKSVELEYDRLNAEQGRLTGLLAIGELTFDEYNLALEKLQVEKEANDLRAKQINQEVDYNQLLTDIVAIQENAVKNGLSTLATQEKITSLVAKRIFDENDINNLSEEQLALVNQITQSLIDQSKTYAQVKDINEQLVQLTQQINDGITKQSEKLSKEQFKQLQAFIVANRDKINEIQDFFATATEETTNLTEEQLEAINAFINRIKFDTLEEKVADLVGKIVQEFNNISSQLQNILATQISLQLEQLDYYSTQILAEVGDETEKQRALQEEIRKDIEKQKFELNKKGRLQELKFQLAGAIASGAQSVTNALATPAPPPIPQILAGIYAGLTAAQIAVIKDQIGFVQSTTFQARRGGLVTGNSHEYGGVMARGGQIELEGGEAIINRNAVAQFSDLLSQINLSTGGRAITGNDSEIAQEIRKQNQTPIKTYVLYNDIQDTNKINSKLEQISRL